MRVSPESRAENMHENHLLKVLIFFWAPVPEVSKDTVSEQSTVYSSSDIIKN